MSEIGRMGLFLFLLAAFTIDGFASPEHWQRERPHNRHVELVAFVKPGRLNWRPLAIPGVAPAEFKLLSFDEQTKARTQLVRLPAGWQQPAGYHSSNLEMFVVDGGVSIEGVAMGRYSYAYYPAGTTHRIATDAGATILQWWSGPPDFVADTKSRTNADVDAVIDHWRFGDNPYSDPADFPKFRERPFPKNSPVRMKLLRHDSRSGEKTWIVMTPGGGPEMWGEGELPPWRLDSAWTEGFLLAGDMTIAECLPRGELAGSYHENEYFYRPAGVPHGGPSLYSDTYAIWLYRSGPGHWQSYENTCTPAPSLTEQLTEPQ